MTMSNGPRPGARRAAAPRSKRLRERRCSGAGRALIVVVALLVAGAPVLAASVRLYGQSNFERTKEGADQTVRVEVSPADGVTSIDLAFHYDPAVVTPVAVHRTAFTEAFAFTSDFETSGTVEIHLSGSTPLAGTGDVAWISFNVIGSAGSPGALAWGSAVLNGGAIASTTQVSRDILVGTSDVTFSIPDDIQTTPSSVVVVSVSATHFTFANGIDLRLRYNEAVASVTGVAKTTLTNPFTLVWNHVAPGVVQMLFSGTAEPTGSGPVADVTFNVAGGTGDSMPLNLDLTRTGGVVKFADDGSLSLCPASCNDGDPCTADSCVLGQCVHDAIAATAPTEPPLLTLQSMPGEAILSWSTVPLATSYDVVRGILGTLRSGGGGFTSAVDACLENDLVGATLQEGVSPASGEAFWYIVRPVNCVGSGTYDTDSPSQIGPRDAGIQASALACP